MFDKYGPDSIAPMVQPLEDEEAGAEGDDGTRQEQARQGTRGVIRERERDRAPLGGKVGVQTRSRKPR